MKLSNLSKDYLKVLNLVISGIPSIRLLWWLYARRIFVLNLIITGVPLIQNEKRTKWKTMWVLNLIITGLPSILTAAGIRLEGDIMF